MKLANRRIFGVQKMLLLYTRFSFLNVEFFKDVAVLRSFKKYKSNRRILRKEHS